MSSCDENISRDILSLIETQRQLVEYLKNDNKYISLQQKLDTMDRELVESFKRVHDRVDNIDHIQSNDNGCTSVKFLKKDLIITQSSVSSLKDSVKSCQKSVSDLKIQESGVLSSNSLRWAIGMILVYLVSFGTYVVKNITKTNTDIAKLEMLTERNKNNITDVVKHQLNQKNGD